MKSLGFPVSLLVFTSLIPMIPKTSGYFTIGTTLSFSSLTYYIAFYRSTL
ncbi:MAG: hypothetical protein H8E26_04015 [FCB group bacterium]|nr:hypothetical protein [FCB group bacterium]